MQTHHSYGSQVRITLATMLAYRLAKFGPDVYLPAGDLEGGSEDLRAYEFCHGDGIDGVGGSDVFWLKKRRSRKRNGVMDRGAWGTAEPTNNDVGVFMWLEIKDSSCQSATSNVQ